MGTRLFYVGYHGGFDRIAAAALRSAKQHHAEIGAYLLLSYHPAEQAVALPKDFDGSFFPLIPRVPRRFAIVQSNKYMVNTVDSIICYVCHPGNTRNLLEYAQRRNSLRIRNIASQETSTP